ncbi:hypothetical protein AB9F45_39785, partial [Rhizobium leguminosarum]|uniref:copper amine oxidase n=1 Tax=Rhizobium leguminosarum TaxID=384 RepID=UPI003F970718
FRCRRPNVAGDCRRSGCFLPPAVANGETGRYWKVSNPNIKKSVGKAPGYKIVVMPSPVMLAQQDSTVAQRGGFAKK